LPSLSILARSVLVRKTERFLCGLSTSTDRGSQKDSEICLTTVSLLFFAFLGLFKPFFDYFDNAKSKTA
jgi:hypothetical protein